jgi:hypothetical protein
VLAVEMKEFFDRVVRREEPLRLARRFEAFHLLLASPCRLVRILCPVFEPFMLARACHVVGRADGKGTIGR